MKKTLFTRICAALTAAAASVAIAVTAFTAPSTFIAEAVTLEESSDYKNVVIPDSTTQTMTASGETSAKSTLVTTTIPENTNTQTTTTTTSVTEKFESDVTVTAVNPEVLNAESTTNAIEMPSYFSLYDEYVTIEPGEIVTVEFEYGNLIDISIDEEYLYDLSIDIQNFYPYSEGYGYFYIECNYYNGVNHEIPINVTYPDGTVETHYLYVEVYMITTEQAPPRFTFIKLIIPFFRAKVYSLITTMITAIFTNTASSIIMAAPLTLFQ